jgi:hypothetical protein
MNTRIFKNEPTMLPSVAAFLDIWDDPNEFTHLEFAAQGRQCQVTVLVEAPDCPLLTMHLPSLIMGTT